MIGLGRLWHSSVFYAMDFYGCYVYYCNVYCHGIFNTILFKPEVDDLSEAVGLLKKDLEKHGVMTNKQN